MKYYITIIDKSNPYIIKATFIVRDKSLYIVTTNIFKVNIYSTNKPRVIYAEKVRRILTDKTHENMYKAGFTTLQAAEEALMKHYLLGYDFLLEDDKSIIEVLV